MYWKEIKNDYFETARYLYGIKPEEGDVLARISIDAWRTADDEEAGQVIAEVILSTHGDIVVSYRDQIAVKDKEAQAAIQEAKEKLRQYFNEQAGESAKAILDQNLALALALSGYVDQMHRKEDVTARLDELIQKGKIHFSMDDFTDTEIGKIAEMVEEQISLTEDYFAPYWKCVETAIHEFILEKKEKPVARIDFLGSNGKVGDSMEYHTEADFLAALKEELDNGVPLVVVLYQDKDGNTISKSFLEDLDTMPKGLKVEDLP